MARSYQAQSYSQGFRPENDRGDFQGRPIQTRGSNFQSSLGGAVNVANNYGSLRRSAVRFDDLAAASIANRSAERATATEQAALAEATGLSTLADVKGNMLIAEAQEKSAKAQAKGSMMGSVFGAIGSIGGALLSDESTKHTVERIDDALATLRNLKPVTFYYKEEFTMSPERMHHGFIAQDYAKVMPDATYYDEELGKMCIDTSELISLLVRSVQQLETRVARMEAAHALAGVK